MPHLDIFGLSEAFILANAGDIHWSLITKMTAKTPTDWKDDRGNRVYASFVYAYTSYNRNVIVKEGSLVKIKCRALSFDMPFFLTETRYISEQSGLSVTVQLLSAFVVKKDESNRRFVRSTLPIESNPFGQSKLESFKKRHKEIREYECDALIPMAIHKINPSVDFNAAKFMYFVNYSQIFKRYENPEISSSFPMSSREIAYLSNVDPFEQIGIYAHQKGKRILSEIRRSSDQQCIARSISENC